MVTVSERVLLSPGQCACGVAQLTPPTRRLRFLPSGVSRRGRLRRFRDTARQALRTSVGSQRGRKAAQGRTHNWPSTLTAPSMRQLLARLPELAAQALLAPPCRPATVHPFPHFSTHRPCFPPSRPLWLPRCAVGSVNFRTATTAPPLRCCRPASTMQSYAARKVAAVGAAAAFGGSGGALLAARAGAAACLALPPARSLHSTAPAENANVLIAGSFAVAAGAVGMRYALAVRAGRAALWAPQPALFPPAPLHRRTSSGRPTLHGSSTRCSGTTGGASRRR